MESHRNSWRLRWLFVLGGAVVLAAVVLILLLHAARQYASTRACRQTMRSLAFGSRMYANEHEGRFPVSLIETRREVENPRVLLCPSVSKSNAAASWESLTPENITYEVVTPGLAITNTNSPFLRCPIHGLVVFADSSVKRESLRH